MVGTLTKRDLTSALSALEGRMKFATAKQLNHAVDILERKIERSEKSIRDDLGRQTDRSIDELSRSTANVISELSTKEELSRLDRRVGKLEKTIGR